MFVGTDGGIHLTCDRGPHLDYLNTVPLAQFYEIAWTCAALLGVRRACRTTGAGAGPAAPCTSRASRNEDWFRVGGGDGFYPVVDPADPDIVYVESQDGNVRRFDRRTTRAARHPPRAARGRAYRFNWNSPILVSPHDPKTIYYGGNRLFGSQDRGRDLDAA